MNPPFKLLFLLTISMFLHAASISEAHADEKTALAFKKKIEKVEKLVAMNSNLRVLRTLSRAFTFAADPNTLPSIGETAEGAAENNKKTKLLYRAQFALAVAIMRRDYKIRIRFVHDEANEPQKDRKRKRNSNLRTLEKEELKVWVGKVLNKTKKSDLITQAILAESKISQDPSDEKAIKFFRNLKAKNKMPDVNAWRALATAEWAAGDKPKARALIKMCQNAEKRHAEYCLSARPVQPEETKEEKRAKKRERTKRFLRIKKRNKEILEKYAD